MQKDSNHDEGLSGIFRPVISNPHKLIGWCAMAANGLLALSGLKSGNVEKVVSGLLPTATSLALIKYGRGGDRDIPVSTMIDELNKHLTVILASNDNEVRKTIAGSVISTLPDDGRLPIMKFMEEKVMGLHATASFLKPFLLGVSSLYRQDTSRTEMINFMTAMARIPLIAGEMWPEWSDKISSESSVTSKSSKWLLDNRNQLSAKFGYLTQLGFLGTVVKTGDKSLAASAVLSTIANIALDFSKTDTGTNAFQTLCEQAAQVIIKLEKNNPEGIIDPVSDILMGIANRIQIETGEHPLPAGREALKYGIKKNLDLLLSGIPTTDFSQLSRESSTAANINNR